MILKIYITYRSYKYLDMVYAFQRQMGIWLRPIYNSLYADVVKKSFKKKLKEEKLYFNL